MGWGVPDGWVEPSAISLNRCLVRGVWRAPDGSAVRRAITIIPERGGCWHGEVVAADAINITPGPDGIFEAPLVPSVAVGRYMVSMGDMRLVIEVPDVPAADLLNIQVKEDQGNG